MEENIKKKDLTSWFESGFTSYGMSVIKERAFVDIRDGLKPVNRAIVYEILKSGATSDSKPTKVARISGNVIGNWHPHGDKAVEDALAGMAQSWTNSLPTIYIKGNGGTVFGDGAAAGRYIEARLTPAGDAYGHNLKEGIVPFIPNFDETGTMPTVLPAQLPYVLINGISEGIAVGVSSVMPPQNPKTPKTPKNHNPPVYDINHHYHINGNSCKNRLPIPRPDSRIPRQGPRRVHHRQ